MGVIDRDASIYGNSMKLRQVGRMQVSRILGSVSNDNGAYKALIDLLERSYFLRAEVNAMTKVLIDKGVMTAAEWQKAVDDEMRQYVADLSEAWPEIEFGEDGFTIKDTAALADRMKREGWPP